jgi:hypothetical protein
MSPQPFEAGLYNFGSLCVSSGGVATHASRFTARLRALITRPSQLLTNEGAGPSALVRDDYGFRPLMCERPVKAPPASADG